MRRAAIATAALLIGAAVIQSGKPWHGEDHGYGYPWEHSLAEWAVITAHDRQHPRQCAVYNWANYFDDGKWHEQLGWVMVPCQ